MYFSENEIIMIGFIIAVVVILFLIFPGKQLNRKTGQSVKKQVILLIALVLIYAFNLLYNWGFFADHKVVQTNYDLVVKYTEYVFRYLILISVVILVYNMFIKKRNIKQEK